ncbi:unnamed protein product, partial [Anisakis simplex]|uniref:Uncharacterized protein n=1 Tax=Anisakis simplex TaxID=6269 RepID=A0A0M3JLC2_ANISI
MAIVCIDGAQLNETSNSDAEILRTDPTMMLLTETTRQSETDARIGAQLLPGTEDSQISTKELKLMKDSRVELEKSDEIEAENVARMEKELCSEGRGWKGVVEVKEDGGGKALTLEKGRVKEDENDRNAFTSNFVELRADVSAEVGHDELRCG